MQVENIVVNVSVKWGTEKYSDLQLDLGAPLEKFKQLLNKITTVPVNKQKIIYKGQTLKDDTNLMNLKIPQGALLMLMGQAEGQAIVQVQSKTVFVEDLTAEQRAQLLKEKAGIVLPAGLVNLGNTCYMNSSIQCMRRVNELRQFLLETKFKQETQCPIQSKKLFKATQQLFNQLEKKGMSFPPKEFVIEFMNIFPMFHEREQNGHFKQQDADECFQNILSTIEPMCWSEGKEGQSRNLIRELFEIQSEITLQNAEIPEEPVTIQQEKNKKLMCIIDNESKPINTLVDGIRISLEGQLMKISEIDNQNHIYNRTSRIKKLPSYLLVQMVRFYWKQGVQGKEGTKSKILRQVSFPKILDVADFCTEQLKSVLQEGRDLQKQQLLDHQQHDKDKLEEFKRKYEESGKILPTDTKEIFKKFKEDQKEENIKLHDQQLYGVHGEGLETGEYEIIAVLTHQGRFADSGHYIAWVHESGDRWICYNDDIVEEKTLEDILALRGGGDWHMGYYLLYRKLEVKK